MQLGTCKRQGLNLNDGRERRGYVGKFVDDASPKRRFTPIRKDWSAGRWDALLISLDTFDRRRGGRRQQASYVHRSIGRSTAPGCRINWRKRCKPLMLPQQIMELGGECSYFLHGVQQFLDILTPPFFWPRLTDLDILQHGE